MGAPGGPSIVDDPFGLKGRICVVTGGTRGIGWSIASALAGAGARVVVTARTERDVAKAAARLQKKYRTPCLGVPCDVSQRSRSRDLFEAIEEWSPAPLQAVVNNAGHPIVPDWWSRPLHQLPAKELDKAFHAVAAVDVDGARWVTLEALKRMLPQRRGSLVFMSSTPAITGYRGFPYTEAKAAVLGLMRDLARVYGPKGIRSNAIAPGNIRTGWLTEIPVKERRILEQENPLRRFGEPGEVANVALFLASEMSSFVTGETIIVDGGTVIR